MPEETPDIKREFQEEADDLIKLGTLLRVSRSEADQLSVEKIMRSDLAIQEKIRKIEEIDQAAAAKSGEGKPQAAAEAVQPAKKRPVKETIFLRGQEPPPRDLKRSGVKSPVYVKATHTPLPYFAFLFREYRKIREFGKRTHILLPVLFPPSVRLNRDAGAALTKHLHPVSNQLLEILNQVLQVGWLHLHKADYNLVAVMKKLCLEINMTNFHLLNYKDKKLLNRLRTLENLFLILQYRVEDPARIISAVEKVLNLQKNIKGDPTGMSKLVRKILGRDVMLPSLYNFILGLNMRKYNRFFTLNELIRRSSAEIIDSGNFDCEAKVYDKIQSYIRKSEKALTEMQKKKKEIQKQRIFLPTDENGDADFSQLQLFYDALQQDNKYNFSKDKENIVLFVPRFLRLFLQSFEQLLNRKVNLSETGEIEIFSSTFFQIESSKLNYLINKMEKIVFSFPHFPRNRYLGIKISNTGPIAIETEFMHLTEESLVHLLNIAKKLSEVLGLRRKTEKTEETFEPLDLNILRGKSFSLPFEEESVISETLINGRSVHQSLTLAVTVIFLTGVYLNDQTSLSLLNMEKYIDQKMQSILEKLERIADQDTFQRIKDSIRDGL